MQGEQGSAVGPIQLSFINKVLLESSCAHLFKLPEWVLSHYNGRGE